MMKCEIKTEPLPENYHTNVDSIPKINQDISYADFFENYLLTNVPCVIKNVTSNWSASNNWIKNGEPNLEYLLERYGDFEVTVSDCNVKHFNAQKTKCMRFKEYVNYFDDYRQKLNESLLYLKDWHLLNMSKENFYTVPLCFSSDWLNEYFTENTQDDYRFVYIGPKGTWTPFHVDVFTSFSWSTNVCGQKKWLLFPPGEENSLKDALGNLPYDVIENNSKHFEIVQEAGDAMFVPSGWHHQVYNEADTISINHNWVNGCNVERMWESLLESLKKVKKEIDDCKEMDGWLNHCQLMLKTYHGMDFYMFYDFLMYIANKRIQLIMNNVEIKQFDVWILGKQHAVFDLIKIKSVLQMFIKHENFIELNITQNPFELIESIEKCLNK